MVFVAPQSHEELFINKKTLVSKNGKESYAVMKGIPILLPEKTNPDWNRELIEIIFWDHPEAIVKMYDEIHRDKAADWNEIYIKYIKKTLGTKDNIFKAFDSYRQKETDVWIAGDGSGTVKKTQLKAFQKLAKRSIGKRRTVTKIEGTESIWGRYRYFGALVCKEKTDKLLELATGAGGGTASVSLYMSQECELYTVDIDFACLGNAVGIGKYQKKNIIPVCASFWYLPFKDQSFDTICTVCGLDESREIPVTLKEVSRVLTDHGRFVVVSRDNAFMRQHRILEPFGFTEKETLEILEKCRMFSDLNSLDTICGSLGLVLLSRKTYREKDSVAFSVSEYKKLVQT